MEVNPVFLAGLAMDADEFVDEAFAEFGILDDGAEFLVEEFVTLLPVNLGVCGWEIEGHEFGEVMLDGFFPGAVVVVGWVGVFDKFTTNGKFPTVSIEPFFVSLSEGRDAWSSVRFCPEAMHRRA